jgi:hypothetical protein
MLSFPGWLTQTLTIVMAALTVISGAQYFISLKDVFKE